MKNLINQFFAWESLTKWNEIEPFLMWLIKNDVKLITCDLKFQKTFMILKKWHYTNGGRHELFKVMICL